MNKVQGNRGVDQENSRIIESQIKGNERVEGLQWHYIIYNLDN